jgi:hypothetical protein
MRNIKTNTMRMFSLIAAVLSLGLVMAVSPMAASAAEIAENAAVTIAEEIGEDNAENAEDAPETISGEDTADNAEDAPETISGEDSAEDTDDSPVTVSSSGFSLIQPIHAHAEEGGAGGGGGSADSSFKTVIEFFVKWIGRIGGVVAFVGAVMFALAIKNNDAEAKQSALLTMIAGFVAAAVAAASNMFNMFA